MSKRDGESVAKLGQGAGGTPSVQGCWKGPAVLSLSVETLLFPPSKGQSIPGTESHTPGLAENRWHTSGRLGGWVSLLSMNSSLAQVSSHWGPGTSFTLEMRMGLLIPAPLRSPVLPIVL